MRDLYAELAKLAASKEFKLTKEEAKELKAYLVKQEEKLAKDYEKAKKNYEKEAAKIKKEYEAYLAKAEKEVKAYTKKVAKEYAKYKKDNKLTDKDVAKQIKQYIAENYWL